MKGSSYSLSSDDISDYLDGKIKIITYKELRKYQSIDQLLHPYDVVAILYETRPNYGHWTLMYKMNGMIYFFDSYGLVIDDELKFVNENLREQLGESYKYLTRLVYLSPYELDYNPYQFQDLKKNVTTCGRWVLLRYSWRELNIDQFYQLLKKLRKEYNLTYDQIVTKLIKI